MSDFQYVVSEEIAKKEVDTFLKARKIYKGSALYKRFEDAIIDVEMMVMEGFISFDFENQKIQYKSETHTDTINIPFRITTKDKGKLNGVAREDIINLTNACVQVITQLPLGVVLNMDNFDIERLMTLYAFL